MTNWFAGLGQALSGMDAARYGLSLVSQNIANADTPGYTRELSVQTSGVLGVDGAYNSTGVLASGVRTQPAQRADDPVLDARVRNEHAAGANADTTTSVLGDVEALFPEPTDSALGGQLSDFWAAWGTVANDPGSSPSRTVLLQKAQAVVTTLQSTSSALNDVATSTAAGLTNDLSSANAAASTLATLNGHIAVATATGGDTAALLDQRDQALDQLSKLVGGVATINANGTASVSVGGVSLVNGVTAGTLSANSSYQVSVGGTAVTLADSSASAETTMLTTVLPGYQSQLDGVANALASSVNSVQAAGYDQVGNAGAALFSGSGAAGITLTTTDPSKIAASSTPGGNLDGSNALAASQQGTAANGPDSAYQVLVGNVATDNQAAQSTQSVQTAVVNNVDNLKSSVSGVNYDEEVTNMLTYQHAFQASSRVLTTLDDMLDTLINHTGRVGQA